MTDGTHADNSLAPVGGTEISPETTTADSWMSPGGDPISATVGAAEYDMLASRYDDLVRRYEALKYTSIADFETAPPLVKDEIIKTLRPALLEIPNKPEEYEIQSKYLDQLKTVDPEVATEVQGVIQKALMDAEVGTKNAQKVMDTIENFVSFECQRSTDAQNAKMHKKAVETLGEAETEQLTEKYMNYLMSKEFEQSTGMKAKDIVNEDYRDGSLYAPVKLKVVGKLIDELAEARAKISEAEKAAKLRIVKAIRTGKGNTAATAAKNEETNLWRELLASAGTIHTAVSRSITEDIGKKQPIRAGW